MSVNLKTPSTNDDSDPHPQHWQSKNSIAKFVDTPGEGSQV